MDSRLQIFTDDRAQIGLAGNAEYREALWDALCILDCVAGGNTEMCILEGTASLFIERLQAFRKVAAGVYHSIADDLKGTELCKSPGERTLIVESLVTMGWFAFATNPTCPTGLRDWLVTRDDGCVLLRYLDAYIEYLLVDAAKDGATVRNAYRMVLPIGYDPTKVWPWVGAEWDKWSEEDKHPECVVQLLVNLHGMKVMLDHGLVSTQPWQISVAAES